MINIPENVKIGCYNYKIEECNLLDNSSNGTIGLCIYYKQLIKIEESLPLELKEETFLHETIHAIDNFLNIDLTEEQVLKLGKGILMFLMDNKEVINNESKKNTFR